MITTNRDTIAIHARRFILDSNDADFIDAFNTMTDCCHNLEDRIDAFADISLTELRDDLDAAVATFCDPYDDDAAIDAFTDCYFDTLRTDRDFIFRAMTTMIRYRLDLIRQR